MTSVHEPPQRQASPTKAGTETQSYYGRPILKEPVWTWEIPVYFFFGGLAGASSTLSLVARAAGNEPLARATTYISVAGDSVSPVFLISDLGRPERFLNMFRVFKVTSPMSVGSWVLGASGTANGFAAACELLGILPRLRLAAEAVSAVLGPLLSTYTGTLVADTSIPVWHEARRELPFVFAGSSAASAGAAAILFVPPRDAGPARRLLVLGAVIEGTGMKLMERKLGFAGEPYKKGTAGRLAKAARALTVAGAAVTAVAGRKRTGATVGAALVLAGGMCLRWSVYKAGFQSARDPRYTVELQRRRLESARD
jgi:formate-dependent nitrite reductase membrane component NrfD